MKINKKILPTMLFVSFLSINVVISPKAEASCDFSISFINSICQYFTGESSDTGSVADDFEEQSSGESDSEVSKQYEAQIQDINAYMSTHNGSLPPNMHITGKKKMPDGTFSVAIKDESGLNNRGMSEIVVMLAPDGQSFAPLNIFHNESDKSDTEVLQEEYNKLTTPIAEGGENELSDSDLNLLNKLQSEGVNIVNDNDLIDSITKTLGVSKEEIATAVAGGVSLAGIYLVSNLNSNGENNNSENDTKTLLEKATERVAKLRKKYGGNNISGSGDGNSDGDGDSTKNAKGNRSTASSGGGSSRTYNPVNLARIRQSINNLPDTSTNCNPAMFSVVKNYILENNSKDWDAQTVNGLASCIIDNAKKYNVSALAIVAQLKAESNFNPAVTSYAGACGIAQFMPSTAQGFGINPWDVGEAIDGQCQYMSNLMKTFGDYSLAWAGYNAGGGAVQQYGGIPPYSETQNYVSKLSSIVGDLTQKYNQLATV